MAAVNTTRMLFHSNNLQSGSRPDHLPLWQVLVAVFGSRAYPSWHEHSLGNFSCFLSRKFSHSVNPDKILDVLLNVQYFRLFHCQTMLVVEEINSMECTGLTALRDLSRPRPVDTFPVATAAAVHQAIAIALVCNPMQLFLVPVGFVDRSGRRMWWGLMPFQFANSLFMNKKFKLEIV